VGGLRVPPAVGESGVRYGSRNRVPSPLGGYVADPDEAPEGNVSGRSRAAAGGTRFRDIFWWATPDAKVADDTALTPDAVPRLAVFAACRTMVKLTGAWCNGVILNGLLNK
jgi:hypothetical protein